jgi:hypothetical protein
LWKELERLPAAHTRGVIADVGNDIAYGFLPAQILAWVEEAADRLLAHTREVTLTDIPAHSVKALSPARFLFFRTLLLPSSRVSREEVFSRVDEVNLGLANLAERKKLRFVHLKPEWYGFDPIHFRLTRYKEAWREVLVGGEPTAPAPRHSLSEWARLMTLTPERRWLFGRKQVSPQTGRFLERGGTIRIY